MYSPIDGHVFCVMYPCRERGKPRLFVRHTRMDAGCPCFPAMDTDEASGSGAVKGRSQVKTIKDSDTKSVFRLPRFSRIPTHGGNDTCKSVPVYAPQSFPDTYSVAPPAFRCPRRHAHYADLALCRILTTRLLHSVRAFVRYHLPVNRMLTRHRRHTHQRHAGCNSAPRLIRIRHIPDARIMRLHFCTDACSFVRRYPAGPAYVSSIRHAYSLTTGEGRLPLRTPQRQGAGETVKTQRRNREKIKAFCAAGRADTPPPRNSLRCSVWLWFCPTWRYDGIFCLVWMDRFLHEAEWENDALSIKIFMNPPNKYAG